MYKLRRIFMEYETVVKTIIKEIRKIKEFNNEKMEFEVDEYSVIYGKGCCLDSKDIMELIIRLDNNFDVELLENVELSSDVIGSIRNLANVYINVCNNRNDEG
jgi:acyl carrier protein